eukprot:365808-Chlamydomonas_euryale.AAC.33
MPAIPSDPANPLSPVPYLARAASQALGSDPGPSDSASGPRHHPRPFRQRLGPVAGLALG